MRIVFMGTPQAAVRCLEKIVEDGHEVVEVWTQPDRPSGRGRRLTAPPVKLRAVELGISVFQPEKIRAKETRDRFVSLKADVAVVVAYGHILTKTYLEAFSMGCINVHFSLLPKYRGAAPVNWAIANGETVTGVTTMKMDRGMDTGDILLTKEVEIGEMETAVELMDRLSLVGAQLLSETLRTFDQIKPRSQNDAESSRAPLFAKKDGWIDWEAGADSISNRIRGFQPFPRSYSSINGQRITFWSSQSLKDISLGRAGEVIKADEGKLWVRCGNGSILNVELLQLAGKAKAGAKDFLNAGKVKLGDVFENE